MLLSEKFKFKFEKNEDAIFDNGNAGRIDRRLNESAILDADTAPFGLLFCSCSVASFLRLLWCETINGVITGSNPMSASYRPLTPVPPTPAVLVADWCRGRVIDSQQRRNDRLKLMGTFSSYSSAKEGELIETPSSGHVRHCPDRWAFAFNTHIDLDDDDCLLINNSIEPPPR